MGTLNPKPTASTRREMTRSDWGLIAALVIAGIVLPAPVGASLLIGAAVVGWRLGVAKWISAGLLVLGLFFLITFIVTAPRLSN